MSFLRSRDCLDLSAGVGGLRFSCNSEDLIIQAVISLVHDILLISGLVLLPLHFTF